METGGGPTSDLDAQLIGERAEPSATGSGAALARLGVS